MPMSMPEPKPFEDYTLLTISAFDCSSRRPWVFLIDTRTNIAIRGWPEQYIGKTRDKILEAGTSIMRWDLADGSDSEYPRVDELTLFNLRMIDVGTNRRAT